MEGGGGGGEAGAKLGTLRLREDRFGNGGGLQFVPDSAVLNSEIGVSLPVITRQKAAAAKQLIENHYKNYLQGLQDRKERRRAVQRKAHEAQVSNDEQQEMLRNLERRETEFMRLQRHKVGIDDF